MVGGSFSAMKPLDRSTLPWLLGNSLHVQVTTKDGNELTAKPLKKGRQSERIVEVMPYSAIFEDVSLSLIEANYGKLPPKAKITFVYADGIRSEPIIVPE